ncbi:MAG: histidine kinase dimerization/phospho-acceptor domain-containing protein [bacterium]
MPIPHSPQARSNRRLTLVAFTVMATMCLLVLVIMQAHRAEVALDEATAHTLRDYTGYAGRLMGGQVFRRFSEQRQLILAPVNGSARRPVAAPTLDDIIVRARQSFRELGSAGDPGIGFFRLDLRTGTLDARGALAGALGIRVADTLKARIASTTPTGAPDLVVLTFNGISTSIAFCSLINPAGKATAVYGYAYTRATAVAAMAQRVFQETPLLPTSFTGVRWNYDTTAVSPGDVLNAKLLNMRITDRAGTVLWESSNTKGAVESLYHGKTVLSTAAGGLVVESAIRPATEPTLIPSAVRRAQWWSLGALLALTLLLATVSLIALGGERLGARARRAEAMQQLALGLRHELNNALASVMLDAELLGEDETLDRSAHERIQAIIEQTDRMRTVLRRLEKSDRLDMVVPYLNEGYMVDLSTADPRAVPGSGRRRA